MLLLIALTSPLQAVAGAPFQRALVPVAAAVVGAPGAGVARCSEAHTLAGEDNAVAPVAARAVAHAAAARAAPVAATCSCVVRMLTHLQEECVALDSGTAGAGKEQWVVARSEQEALARATSQLLDSLHEHIR